MVPLNEKAKQAIKFAAIKEMRKIAVTGLFFLEKNISPEEYSIIRKNLLDLLGNSTRNFEKAIDDLNITLK